MTDDTAYIELEIARGRLQSVVDEAGATLMRTAFSNIVREAKDFACAILTTEGHTVVQSSQSIPAFLGTMTHTIKAVLEAFPVHDWRSGDVVGTNDPWLGTGHLFDLTIVAPVFVDETVVAFAAVVAHLPDIGGRGQGADSRQVFEEGLRIPLSKIATSDRLDPMLTAIVAANVRLPGEVLGDMNAMLNAAAVIAIRLASLCDEMSVARFHHTCNELEARTERFMRRAIQEMPNGTYSAELSSEGIAGHAFTLRLRVDVRDDAIELDFEGTSPQVPAPINSTLSFSRAYAVYAVKCLIAADLPLNEGILRSVKMSAPEGCIVNSQFPAAGEARSSVGHFIPTLLFRALADCASQSIIAECGAPRPGMGFRGTDSQTGRMFSASVIAAGGFGARASKDGISCIAFPTNTETIPIEMIESSSPVLFVEKELIPDSGGAGQFRGGLGQRISVRVLNDSVSASVRAQWLTQSPRGVRSGMPGQSARVEVNGDKVSELSGTIALDRGDVLTVHSPGAGGYGPPAARDRALLAADIEDGYVSDVGRQVYG
jgi:N-methylhydantoinase B